MTWLKTYLHSSLGKKQVMAVTGLAVALFAAFHMLSHLQVFTSPKGYNTYAHNLQTMGALKWVVRSGLALIALIHILTALHLVTQNRAARPVRYKVFSPQRSKFYSRTMALSGIALLLFIVFHILHFTTGDVVAEAYKHYDKYGRHDVYTMMVLSFKKGWVSAAYIGAVAFLCMHLAHGMTSWFQSLGLRHPKYDGVIRVIGPVYSLILLVGYLSVPIAALAGELKPL